MSRPALAADRALAVIDLLAAQPRQRFTLTEIGRDTGINAASLHALLAVLERSGYLVRHPVHLTYGLGPALVAVGTAALDQLPGIREAANELDALSDRLQLEIVLTAPAGQDIVVVGRAGRDTAFGAPLRIGQRLPLAPPLGTVFLAWSSREDIDRWLGRARHALTPSEVDSYRRALATVRDRGYAVALESAARRTFGSTLSARTQPGAFDDMLIELAQAPYQLETVDDGQAYDVSMLAAPIFDMTGSVAAALTATGFPPARSAADLRRVAGEICGTATIITKRTQGQIPGEG